MDHYSTPGFAHEFGTQKIGKKDTCAFKQAFKHLKIITSLLYNA